MTLPTDQDNLRTGLDLMAHPYTWVEAYPHVPLDEGDVGGDVQDGPAWARRFVLWHQGTGLFAVLNVYHYAANDELLEGKGRRWIERQTELMICRDYADPGSTEEHSDTAFLELPDGFRGNLSDFAALVLTGQLTADNLPLGKLWSRAEEMLTSWHDA
jgi:hypothetical protein